MPQIPIEEQRPTGEPRIGTDEWVAEHGERQTRYAGRIGELRRRVESAPWWALLLGLPSIATTLHPLTTTNPFLLPIFATIV